MSKSQPISLGVHFEQFIADQIESGRYASPSEVVRAGLRLLESNENKLSVLRKALIEGERSGRANYSHDALIADLDSDQG